MMKTAEDQRTVTAMIVDERGNAKIMNAYEAGRNSVIYGENRINSHPLIRLHPKHKKDWERGRRDARKELSVHDAPNTPRNAPDLTAEDGPKSAK